MALPYNGGQIGTGNSVAGPPRFGGKWGAITMMNLTAGQYLVVGSVTMTMGGNTQVVYAPICVLNVS